MHIEQVNFGGAGDDNNARRHPVPMQQRQWDLMAAAAEPWERVRGQRHEMRMVIAREGDFVLLGIPGDCNQGQPAHTDEQQQEEEKRSAAQARIVEQMPREMKVMGATKNLQSIRQTNGIEREAPRHEQNTVKPRTKGVSRTGGAADRAHFDTEPLKDARLAELNPEQKFNRKQEVKGHQANAARRIGELRRLPEETQIQSKLRIEREIRNHQRMLWLAEGFLVKGFDLDALNKVQQKFAKID